MPRRPRANSCSNIYHCILRGINKEFIFFEIQDYLKFIKEIKIVKELFNFNLYSYVLMSNHVHFEIQAEKEKLSKIMHSIQVRYSMYFNKKYNRVGHVFQDRYKSFPIENNGYFLDVLRYIHQNPQKAGICKLDEYRWSSYNEYLEKEKICNVNEVLKYFDVDKNKAIKKFKDFNNEILKMKKDVDFLNYEIKSKLKDSEIIYLIEDVYNIKNFKELKKYKKENRAKIISTMKNIKGCNIKQLSRILEISEETIKKDMKNKTCPKTDFLTLDVPDPKNDPKVTLKNNKTLEKFIDLL